MKSKLYSICFQAFITWYRVSAKNIVLRVVVLSGKQETFHADQSLRQIRDFSG